MDKLLRLEIAGVRYDIDPGALQLAGLPEYYRSFIVTGDRAAPLDQVAVSLVATPPPDTSALPTLFETGDSWCLRSAGEDRFLVLAPPAAAGKHIWVAHFSGDCRKVTVYCGEGLFRQGRQGRELANPICYPLDLLLSMQVLATRRGAIIHAAGLALRGKGYLVPGRSGAGKSTFMRQFSGRAHAQSLSDDRVAVRESGGTFRLHGTPWVGEAGIAQNTDLPHAATLFLRQGPEDRLVPLGPAEALSRLIPLASVPWYDAGLLTALLSLLGDLAAAVPAFEFQFQPGPAAADLFESCFA